MLSLRDPRALAAFVLGVILLVVFQVGAGLLLYGGPGLIPSLSVVVAVGALALAAGLHSGGTRTDTSIEALAQVHRSWRFLLLALVGAAVFSLGWTLGQGFGARALAQSLGLTLLVALPLLAGGQVLAQLSQPYPGPDHEPGPVGVRVGVHALAGAAVGALLLGQVLFRAGVAPSSTLLGCLVLASAGALAHGKAVMAPAPPDEGG
jgi:hypothetical protein